ncbi:hypothetical protein [Puia dinghuensis]|uniref:Uncharacterized protein n=1 Tax=Puia dinghuensis TaxID=1792502 RepID=A0A8J2XS76_9BACT|nr:hypothetical protein [Puia dinghuensis]GGA92989.1 hypothetical protein GCM10011511_15500 [Puia dinghuensis]
MNNSLPIVNILETAFFIDWDQKRLTQVNNPNNSIPFPPTDHPDGRVRLLMDKSTKTAFTGTIQQNLLNPNVVEVRLRPPTQIDLQAEKFGYEQSNGYDIENARRILQRIMGPFHQTQNYNRSLKM